MNGQNGTATKAAGLVAAGAVASSVFVGIRAKRHQSRRHRLARIANQRASEFMRDQRVQSVAQAARDSLDAARERASDIDTDELRDQLSHRLAEASRTAREELQPRAGLAAARAKSLSNQVGAQGAARSKEIRNRIQSEMAPNARNWAQQTLSRAQEAFEETRDRATPAVAATKKQYLPAASGKVAATAGIVASALTTGAHRLSQRVSDVELPSAPSKRLPSKVADQSAEVARRASSQVKYVTGETAMIACWSGVLGAVVYYGLLSPERRKQVTEKVSWAFRQVRDMVGDFQGDDGDQSSMTL